MRGLPVKAVFTDSIDNEGDFGTNKKNTIRGRFDPWSEK